MFLVDPNLAKAQLDDVHVRLLMVLDENPSGTLYAEDLEPRVEAGPALGPAIKRLDALALIEDRWTPPSTNPRVRTYGGLRLGAWALSEFGRDVVRLLRSPPDSA